MGLKLTLRLTVWTVYWDMAAVIDGPISHLITLTPSSSTLHFRIMPTTASAPIPEAQLLWFPLGVWVEKHLMGTIVYCVYASVYWSSKLFQRFRMAEVRDYLADQTAAGAQTTAHCPKGYSDWLDEVVVGCKADIALVTDAAAPVTWTLLGAGSCGLVLVLLRKARDAGITLSLPWAPRAVPVDAGGAPVDRHRGAPGPRPPGPPAERPMHQGIGWWVEASFVFMTGLSLFVFALIVWKLLAQPWNVKGPDIPVCESTPWAPCYVYHYSSRSRRADSTWRMIVHSLCYAFNSLVAAAMNGLSVVLVRRELLHDGFWWL